MMLPPTRSRSGFTFIEIVACLLVLGVGIAAAVGIMLYASILSSLNRGRATGMATALSIAVDDAPLLRDPSAWQTAASGSPSATSSGYINGFYVTRTEGPVDTLGSGITSAPVAVDVYDTARGRLIASYTTRLLRANTPAGGP